MGKPLDMSNKPEPTYEEVVNKLRMRYSNVHPLIFYRTVERAKGAGEIFDILESLPKELPVIWDAVTRRWISTDDITQSSEVQAVLG